MRVLLFDDTDGLVTDLADSVAQAGYVVVGTVRTARELPDQVEALQPDVVILAEDSPSRDTMEQVVVVTERTPRPIVLVTNDASPQSMRKAIRAGISAYVVADLPFEKLDTLLDLAVARFEQDQRMRGALKDAEGQLADRKLIERAKGLLMTARGCDEGEAFRMLRKMAMDRNLKLREVAEQVIAIQSLLG